VSRVVDRIGASSRHADERRVVEALRAQASFTAPATAFVQGQTASGETASEETTSGRTRPTGSTTRRPGPPARSPDLLPMDVARLRRALLVALLAGLLLGCLLATLTVLDPGLLPALG
jgi:hypothetical protein